jgi:putative ABC transport system permease protein
MLASIGRDLRHAVRSFGKDRGSIALAILALALGVGASTVIFSIVYSMLIAPYPYRDADHLVYIHIHNPEHDDEYGRSSFTVKEFFDYKEQNHVFTNMLAANAVEVIYDVNSVSYEAVGDLIDPDTFADLDVKPEIGREATESDGTPGAPAVVLISDRLWHERFNRDPKILGTTITVNGTPRTLIAVMPPRFLLFRADVFIPTKYTRDLTNRVLGGSGEQPLYVMWTVGRLKPGVSLAQATADCTVIAHNEAKIYPDLYPKKFYVGVKGVIERSASASMKTMIYILLGAVLMLLLIACCNVANLLLARATASEKEMAVRASLGASRVALIRQALTESFVLAATGAGIGCLLAVGALAWIKAAVPTSIGVPEEAVIAVSWGALAATAAITMLTALICGLAPALRAVQGDLQQRLMSSGKAVGTSSRHGALRNLLVASQVGLSIVLLVGAGLMLRTFFALEHVDLGFNPNNVLVARVVFPAGTYQTAAQKETFFRQVLPRLGALPGVASVSAAIAPPSEDGLMSQVTVPGRTHSDAWRSSLELVSEGYFQTVGLPLLRGALLSAQDVDSVRQVTVINRKLAHDFFGNENPIGRTIKFDVFDHLADTPHNAFFQIVGIVGDARNVSLEQPPGPEAFVPYAVTGLASRTLLLRTEVDPLSVLTNVREEIASIDQSVALSNASTLQARLEVDYVAGPAFGLVLLGVFAGIGLILSAIGVFSVMAYSVSLQTHDIGVRMALGAQPEGVLRILMLKGLRPILAGVAGGLLASYGLTRLLASQIYGVTATDPWTFGGVVILLVLVGMTACLLPARRAMSVDPMVALRHE